MTKIKSSLAFCLLLTIPLTLACPDDFSSESPTGKSGQLRKPKLALIVDQPRRADISQYFHDLGNDVILINKTGTLPLRLDCWAPYPIDLRFYGHLTNQETTVKTFRKEFGSKGHVKSCFIINATMESYEQITGNYSCFAVDNRSLSSSYYIFVSPTRPGFLLTRGQKIAIQPKLSDKVVTFPCGVSHPEVRVQLFQNQNEPLPLSPTLSYDPKLGFTMTINPKDALIYGEYSCKTELGSNDQVNFTLLPPKKFQVDPPTSNIRLSPHEQLNVSCKSSEDFIMVTSPTPDEIPVETNDVKYFPQALHYKYFGRFISKRLKEGTSGYISCKWKRTNETFAQWAFSVSEGGSVRSGQLDLQKIVSACPNASHTVLHECHNLLECRINSCIRKDSTCHSEPHIHLCHSLKEHNCASTGLVQCLSNPSVTELFFTGFPNTASNKTYRYVDWKLAKASNEELLMLEHSEESFIPKRKTSSRDSFQIQVTCEGSNFVFSSGFKWNLIYKNGTKLELNSFSGDGFNVSIISTLKNKKSNLQSILRITVFQTKDFHDMAQFECLAPIWNSWEWIGRNISLEYDQIAPKRTFRNGIMDFDTSSKKSTAVSITLNLLNIMLGVLTLTVILMSWTETTGKFLY